MVLSGTRWLKMVLSNVDIVKDGIIVNMALSSKKQRSRSCPLAKRQKLDEAGNYSFVATEELSQPSCNESISDDDFSDDETDSVWFKTSQNLTDCVNTVQAFPGRKS